MIFAQPFQKRDALRDGFAGSRRRVALEAADGVLKLRQHLVPVAHRHAHLRKYVARAVDQRALALLVEDGIKHDSDDAFANFPAHLDAQAARIPLGPDNRMKQGMGAHVLCGQFSHERIEKKRHVVIHGEKYRLAERLITFGRAEFQQLGQRVAGPAQRGALKYQFGNGCQ